MRLYLMRHGQALDRADPNCPPDAERPLTSTGRRRTQQAARGLKWLGIAPRVILTSPMLRARQTADIVAKEFGLGSSLVVQSDILLPGAGPQLLRANLRRRRAFEVLCVGHVPHLDRAIAHLLGAPDTVTELKKSSTVALSMPAGGTSTLDWMLTASMLHRLAQK